MATLWLNFAFLTASVYATLSLLDKIVLDHDVSTPFVTSAFNTAPKFGVFLLVGVVTDRTGIELLAEGTVVPLLIGASVGALNVYSRMIYYMGMEATDVSRFVPVINTDVVFVLVMAAVFLGETFAPPVYLGILVIFLGTMLISFENLTDDARLISRTALTFGILSAFTIALSSLLLKILVPVLPRYTILFWFGIGGVVSILLHGGWKRLRGTLGDDERDRRSVISPGRVSLMVSGVITAVSYFTLVRALETGPVSIVTAIVNLEVLLVFFGVLVLSKFTPEVLQESMDRVTLIQKFSAAVLMVAGVVIIQVFS